MNHNRAAQIERKDLEPQEKLLLELFEKEQELTIFDIGACEGESSIRYSKMFPKSVIYCFEPLPKNFLKIKENIKSYNLENIIPNEICLSDSIGEVEFNVSSGTPKEFEGKDIDWDFGNKSSSILKPNDKLKVFDWLNFNEIIKVNSMTLANFISNQSIRTIDFIHMDVQGAELMVLNGAYEKIDKINNIWLEVESVQLYKGQPVKKDIEKFFKSKGFTKIIDTVDFTLGDQFWTRTGWIQKQKSKEWIDSKLMAVKAHEKKFTKSTFTKIRETLRIRSRINSLVNRL